MTGNTWYPSLRSDSVGKVQQVPIVTPAMMT